MCRQLTNVFACGLLFIYLTTQTSAEPIENDNRWVRGSLEGVRQPIWGHVDGLRIGLAPLRGPRGLLRIYAPYLDSPDGRVINFIAIEPIPEGATERGLSELEYSRLDKVRGKRFWSGNNLADSPPKSVTKPSEGFIENIDGQQCLCVYVLIEPFDNGAHVYLKLTFRPDQPHEVVISTFAHGDSIPLEYCIVTATMGNYARLRRLQLANRVAIAGDLWPRYQGDEFAPHARFPLDELIRTVEGHAVAFASTDETDPSMATYAPGTRTHWHYSGKLGVQGWKSHQPDLRLEVWVNGRYTYWGSQNPIPGGIAFENFEMVSPFRQGEEFIFVVEPLSNYQ